MFPVRELLVFGKSNGSGSSFISNLTLIYDKSGLMMLRIRLPLVGVIN